MFTVLPAILQMGQIKFNWNLSEYRLHGSQFMTVVMVDIYYIMLLPSGVSVASEARPIIAFYSRFRDICIYIYIYTLIPILSAGGIFFIYTS